MMKPVILTGDRPSGPLHLGHYVGSLANRVHYQQQGWTQYIIIADVQALTDNYEHPHKVHDNVFEVACDYLAVGLDPAQTTFFIQSQVPEIADLTIYYLNLVTVNRLRRNPTVKTEIEQKGFRDSIPAGFFVYPVSQAADITCVKATTVPVGEDQLPMIEQTNEIVRTFNRIYKKEVLTEVRAIVPEVSRLVGIDGKTKMSKSLGNAIYLSDSADVVAQKVKSMYTDPSHIKVSDPGQVEGNTVFTYLDVFDTRKDEVVELKAQYKKGGLGDMVLKKRLTEVLNNFLDPIRTRRAVFYNDKASVMEILKKGTLVTREVAANTVQEVKDVMYLNY